MTPAEIQRELDELDTRLERLRVKYDQFFTGIEKMLPYVQRKDVDRRFQALQRVQMRNTGMRFRFQTLVQRFTSYQTYWNRITRQIEEGTFRRDVIKAQRMGLGAAAVAAAKQAAEDASELPPEFPSEPEEIDEFEAVEPEPEAPIVPPPLRDGFRDPLVVARAAPPVCCHRSFHGVPSSIGSSSARVAADFSRSSCSCFANPSKICIVPAPESVVVETVHLVSVPA